MKRLLAIVCLCGVLAVTVSAKRQKNPSVQIGGQILIIEDVIYKE